MSYIVRMMPGQTPYTKDELAKLNDLVSKAAKATEQFDDDELEMYAKLRGQIEKEEKR